MKLLFFVSSILMAIHTTILFIVISDMSFKSSIVIWPLVLLSALCSGLLFAYFIQKEESKPKNFDFEIREAVDIVETAQEILLHKGGQVSPFEWDKMHQFLKKYRNKQ